jgi:hypothetical protein
MESDIKTQRMESEIAETAKKREHSSIEEAAAEADYQRNMAELHARRALRYFGSMRAMQGKLAILRHENNKLRKRNETLKFTIGEASLMRLSAMELKTAGWSNLSLAIDDIIKRFSR